MRFAGGGRGLERLAGGEGAPGGGRGRTGRGVSRWKTVRSGPDPWSSASEVADQQWLRRPAVSVVREALQQSVLFPATRFVARPRVIGAADLIHAPQPAVLAPNHGSDIDTPLVLSALPRAWRVNTVVGAASERFYRRRHHAVVTTLWLNTFPFDRNTGLRGVADAAELLREGYNVLLFPQGTRATSGLTGFRTGVARLCLALDVPLIPVHVGNTALIWPKGRGPVGRGVRTSVTFGRPLYPRPDEEPPEFMARAADAIAALAERRPT